ncbi:FecR family protein [Luteimonas suaedae]|uniref:FecR family protein n=1 Tax=Luteimonas suaedae TaxID=2605430 RepID=UPI0011ED6C8E|nr:FecR domain-containing protein [Luteimonas suaedae]
MALHDMDEHLAAEADRWLLRMQDPDRTETERRQFEAWLRRDRAHLAAYRNAERLWRQLGQAVRRPEVRDLPEAALPPAGEPGRRIARRNQWLAAAACLLLVVAGFQFLRPPRPAPPQSFATATGETRRAVLDDGSVVTLDTDSRIAVAYTDQARRIEIAHGNAFFDVAADASRPFVVDAGPGRATVLGTRFQMNTASGRLEVVLVEGSLQLEHRGTGGNASPPALVVLEPGQSARLDGQAAGWRIGPADVEARTAWLQGRLIFRDTPLPVALAEFNRYSTVKLRIGDARLEALTIHGVFRTGDQRSFALALASTLPVRVQDVDGDLVLRDADVAP